MIAQADHARWIWGRHDGVGLYTSLARPAPIDPARFGVTPELDARLAAATVHAPLVIVVTLTDEPAHPVAKGIFVLLEPLAHLVFAVSPNDMSVTAHEDLFDAEMEQLFIRANELVQTESPATALACIAGEIERRWSRPGP